MIALNVIAPAAAAGVLVGLGVRAAWPAKPDLTSALDRLDASKVPTALPTDALVPTGSLPERVGDRLLADFGDRIALPLRDLNLLRISPAEHLGKRALFALYGLVIPLLLQAMLALAGAPFPYVVPAGLSLGLAVLFWLWPGREVAKEAAEARLIVRHAAASYLERVALARVANSGAAQGPDRHRPGRRKFHLQPHAAGVPPGRPRRCHPVGRPQAARRGARHPRTHPARRHPRPGRRRRSRLHDLAGTGPAAADRAAVRPEGQGQRGPPPP
ncbi:hypothetical protein RKD37_000181 [Streptomyces ambofaciens]